MSPLADSANPPAQIDVAAAEELLDGGEVILLATRPSGWFVPLTSAPVLTMALLVAAATTMVHKTFEISLPWQSIFFVCGAVGSIRVALACVEWVGRLYILTTRRVLRVQGVIRAEIEDCPLSKIAATTLTASAAERPLGVGSLFFQDDQGRPLEPSWTCLARPAEVHQAVQDAIRRAR